jgi:hypothetical protein
MSSSAPPIKHATESLALAYELRSEGIRWKLIERYLGKGIRDAVERAKRNGIAHIASR